jgi:hypothetical protein
MRPVHRPGKTETATLNSWQYRELCEGIMTRWGEITWMPYDIAYFGYITMCCWNIVISLLNYF